MVQRLKQPYIGIPMRMMLKKILENLIVNGIDHTGESGSVTVDVRESRISVFSRPGHIDEEIIDDIFEPFVTGAQGEDIGQKKGHGLGLYIAKYFAGKLGLELRGDNMQDGVQFILEKEVEMIRLDNVKVSFKIK